MKNNSASNIHPERSALGVNHSTLLSEIDLKEIVEIAKRAGDAIMEIYDKDFTVEYKDDKSPLTEADIASHNIIVEGLQTLELKNTEHGARSTEHATLPILSEEGKEIPYEERQGWEYYWCIDPIDGTKEFIKKNGEFTVNIALIHKDTPVLGVVYAPALGEMYFAKKGEGAFKARVWGSGFGVPDLEHAERLPLDTTPRTLNSPLVIVASKSHLNPETKAFIENLTKNPEPGTRNPELVSKGSSLKLCMVAEGSADIYPRLAPTMEWDTAAADAIVREAGKMTYQYNPEPGSEGELRSKRSSPGGPNPEPLRYNKQDLLNPWFVVR